MYVDILCTRSWVQDAYPTWRVCGNHLKELENSARYISFLGCLAAVVELGGAIYRDHMTGKRRSGVF